MSVSYRSIPFKSSAYQPPLDLSLFSKVMTIKQQQFDLGAKQEQDQINQLANLDVREVDRPYLNDKINNLVSTINNFGGQDYSDPNILNQIEGLGADIYGDKKVITAVTSMKQARQVIDGYAKYKTDPKFAKLYSGANEYLDIEQVNNWMRNPEVGKAYEGPSSPTPFTPYQDPMIKALKEVKADYYDDVNISGYYISKDGLTRLTPQRLTDIAIKQLTPDQQAQVYRDGAYQYRGAGQDDMVNKSLSQYQQKVDEAKTMKLYYESQADLAAKDPNARSKYLQLAKETDEALIAMTKDPDRVKKAAIDRFNQNPNGFKGEIYQNDFISGMANLFSQNKTTRSVTFDQAAMFQERQKALQEHWDSDYNQKDRHFYADLALKAADKGKVMIVDPITKEISYIPVPTDTGLTGTGLDTRDPKNIKVTPKTLQSAINDNKLQQNQEWNSFFSEYLTAHPEISNGEEASADPNGTGNQRTLKGVEFLEMFNGESGLQYDDLAAINAPSIQGNLKKAGISPEGIDLLINLNKNLQAVMEGKGKTVSDLPRGFIESMANVAMLKEGERTFQAVLDRAYEKELAPLNAEEKRVFKEALNNPKDYKYDFLDNAGISPWIEPGKFNKKEANVKKLAAIEKKLGKSLSQVEGGVQDYLSPLSTHNIFRTKIFTNDDRKNGQLAGLISTEITRGVGDFYIDGKKTANKPFKNHFKIEKIVPQDMGVKGDGTGGFYITSEVTDEDGKTGIYVTDIDASNAKQYGLERDKFEGLNKSVNMLGRSLDIPVYVNNNLAIPISIVRPDLNNVNSQVYAQAKFYEYDNSGKKIPNPKKPGEYLYTTIDIPYTRGNTAGQAYAAAVGYIQKAGENKLKPYDNEGFKQLLITANKELNNQ